MKRLIARTGSKENVYIAVFLMPDSSKQERRQIEKDLSELWIFKKSGDKSYR
jgi:hypothetical protein